jgi:hypothetical protein
MTGAIPTQLPAMHWSSAVHLSLSLQPVPFVAIGFEQVPVVESQVPATWH